jgi:hypothetical protein
VGYFVGESRVMSRLSPKESRCSEWGRKRQQHYRFKKPYDMPDASIPLRLGHEQKRGKYRLLAGEAHAEKQSSHI